MQGIFKVGHTYIICIINICVCAGVSVCKKHVKIKKESSNWFMPQHQVLGSIHGDPLVPLVHDFHPQKNHFPLIPGSQSC